MAIAPYERGLAAPPHAHGEPPPPWRAVAAGPAVAAVMLVTALIVTSAAGVPLRDPNGVSLRRFTTAAALVALLVGVDIAFRAGRARWTAARALAAGGALVSFYVTYLAYRNLKSVVPLLRDELFDRRLADLDRSVFAGHDPAVLLHSLLGTGASAHVLSTAYELFFAFVPVAVAFALVVVPDLRAGLFLTTALAINWALAVASYFLLPSLGPIYADPAAFIQLPHTGVTGLQHALLGARQSFLLDPSAAGGASSIGAFASLHTSILFTAALATNLLGLSRYVKMGVWLLFALTATATIYFGWHYVMDDLAGLAIGVIALGLARAIIGIDLRTARRRLPAPSATPA